MSDVSKAGGGNVSFFTNEITNKPNLDGISLTQQPIDAPNQPIKIAGDNRQTEVTCTEIAKALNPSNKNFKKLSDDEKKGLISFFKKNCQNTHAATTTIGKKIINGTLEKELFPNSLPFSLPDLDSFGWPSWLKWPEWLPLPLPSFDPVKGNG